MKDGQNKSALEGEQVRQGTCSAEFDPEEIDRWFSAVAESGLKLGECLRKLIADSGVSPELDEYLRKMMADSGASPETHILILPDTLRGVLPRMPAYVHFSFLLHYPVLMHKIKPVRTIFPSQPEADR